MIMGSGKDIYFYIYLLFNYLYNVFVVHHVRSSNPLWRVFCACSLKIKIKRNDNPIVEIVGKLLYLFKTLNVDTDLL